MPEFTAPTSYAEFVTRYPDVVNNWAARSGHSPDAANACLSEGQWPEYLSKCETLVQFLRVLRRKLFHTLGVNVAVASKDPSGGHIRRS
jgi:hypothetical protein